VLDALSELRQGTPGAPAKMPTPTTTPSVRATPPRSDRVEKRTPVPAETPAVPAAALPEAAPPSPPPVPPAHASTRSPNEIWSEVLEAVRAARPLIAGWVHNLALLELTGDVAVIGFAPENAIAAESCQLPNNRKFIEELIERIVGCRIALRFVERAGLPTAPAPEPPEVKVEAARDPMEEFKRDPLIRKALEMFKAQIQPA